MGEITSELVLECNTIHESLEEGRHKPIRLFPIIYSLKAFFHLCVTVSLMLNLYNMMSVRVIIRL